MADGTAALRAAAAHWSLAGDQQLLDILQNIHQRIVNRCNETTARLELMSRGLRDASVNLQNVNNKFLALSNTQFVESRVYEDDTDLTPPTPGKDAPKLTELSSDLSKLKESLQVLENYHEPLHILRDSDSDSDSDGGDDRLVLKPKDLYSDRPLPYIIGSQAWKNKWHAGLIQDESDSDSSTSKVGEVEQYSESEDEQADAQLERDYQPDREESTGSSSVHSETVAVSVSPVRPSPSLVAAELARRLGGDVKLPEREPVYGEPDNVVRKLYKPQQTPSAPIFSDQPPPLEASSDDDIFAELHKPHQKRLSNVDALFDFGKGNSLEEALFGRPPGLHEQNDNKSQSPPYEDDLIPEERLQEVESKRDDNIKKPVGGISLFGTNKHAESIGAAILNRNRRKSSTSGDESNTEEVKEVREVKEVKEIKKERDIFDDLFAKSEKLNKKSAKIDEIKPKEVRKDAFSDIFDDIDDIFSTDIVNVQIKETKNNEKPLFDDDDDLFAEIPKPKNLGTNNVKIIEKENSLDEKVKSDKNAKDSKINVIKEIKKESKSLFDSDSDDGLFTNVKENKIKDKVEDKPVEYKISDDIFGDDDGDDLFASGKANLTKSNTLKSVDVSKAALFDSDDESFVKDSKTNTIKDTVNKINVLREDESNLFAKEIKRSDKELIDSKSINDSSDLFNNERKSKALDVIESINNDIFNDGDNLFKRTEIIRESQIETVHENVDKELFTNSKVLSKDSVDDELKNEQKKENIPEINVPNDFESEPPEDHIFDKPNTQIGNILRTTRIAADEDVQTETPKESLFNDSDDELFGTVPPLPKQKEQDRNENLYENVPKPESPVIFSSKNDKNDIFADIFDDGPPIFEKTKEPKKSQNVNALYGDDSDDEALFFKKNDVINDEKPEFSPSGERFGIFNDEPPALDVDFIQKPVKNDSSSQNNVKTDDFKVDANDDFPPKSDKNENKTVSKEVQDTTDNTSKEPKKIGKLKPMNFNINVNTLLPGASPKKKQLEETDGQTASNEELHKTDKIEPKMVKSISFDDPEILDNKLSKERAKIQVKRRPSTRRARKEAVRKSAIDLTDSSLDSNDNSVKEDVKVVKTVYILNDNDIFGDTSNKDSTEGTKKHLNIVDSDEELFKKDETDKIAKSNENDGNDVLKLLKANDEKKSFLDSDDDDIFKNKNNKEKDETNSKVAKSNENYRDNDLKLKANDEKKSFLDSDDDELFKTNTKPKEPKQDEIKEVKNEKKSFLDNDDLFKTNSRTVDAKISKVSNENLFKTNENTKLFLDSDDNDDLFTNKTVKIAPKTLKSNISSDEEDLFTNINKKGIETLGQVYKSDTQSTTKAKTIEKETRNIFDDFPPKDPVIEEKVYVKPQEIKEVVKEKTVKKYILDISSDEDDLFKAKTKLTTKMNKSLFGDDNDDDLFGVNTVKETKQDTMPAPQSVKEAKPSETVFVDPLSLFGDDD